MQFTNFMIFMIFKFNIYNYKNLTYKIIRIFVIKIPNWKTNPYIKKTTQYLDMYK